MNEPRKPSAISRLLAMLREPPHDYRPATGIFLDLDVQRIARELELELVGTERGADNRPAQDAQDFDDIEHQIVERAEGHKQDAHSVYLDQLHTYDERLTALNFEERFAVLQQAALDAVGEFSADAGIGRGTLFALRRRLRDCEMERDHFRERNGLYRPARLASAGTVVLKIGLLAILFVVEVAINGGFLAKSSEQGVLGGAIQAVSFAALNIIASFLCGLVPIRLINRRFGFLKLLGLLSLLLYLAFAVTVNLTLAHLREIPPSLTDDVGHQVLLKLTAAPFLLDDINSWVLFGIGLAFSIVAMSDGLVFTDPFFGYASLERRCIDAGRDYTDGRADLIDRLREIKDSATDAMNEAARALTVRRSEYGAIVLNRGQLARLFTEHQSQIERVCRALLAIYREANRTKRHVPAPGYWATPYQLERIPTVGGGPDESAQAKLGRLIDETQALLKQQVKAVQDAFDQAVQSYREIDDLIPEKESEAPKHKAA
jgi:hypothetical protein